MRTRNTRGLAASLLAALACFTGQAQGAGFAIIENSAQGMGNAFAGGGAVAEDASTVYFNPASMTRLKNQFQISGHAILPSFEFTSQGATAATGAPIQGNTNIDGGTNAAVPNFYYVRKLKGPFSVGLSVNVPFGLKTEYDRTWVGRYQAVESEIKTININPAIGVKIDEHWSIGGGINVMYMDATLSSAVDFRSGCLGVAQAAAAAGNLATAGALGAACAGPADTTLDGFAENKADNWGFGFNAGVMYELSDATRFSLAFRSRVKQKLDGNVTFSLPNNAVIQGLFASSFPRDGISADVTLPDTLSFSGYHRLNQKFALMGDATWTRWSAVQRLVIAFDTPTALRAPATVEELRWDDTWRLGIGLNYYHNDRWTFRLGTAYDESPVSSTTFATARLPDADRVWTSVGASYAFNDRMKFDVGYSHLFVDDSRINRVGSQGDTLTGNFDNDADIFSLQFNYVLE